MSVLTPVRIFFAQGPSPQMLAALPALVAPAGTSDALASAPYRRDRRRKLQSEDAADEGTEILDASDDPAVIAACSSPHPNGDELSLCETNGYESAWIMYDLGETATLRALQLTTYKYGVPTHAAAAAFPPPPPPPPDPPPPPPSPPAPPRRRRRPFRSSASARSARPPATTSTCSWPTTGNVRFYTSNKCTLVHYATLMQRCSQLHAPRCRQPGSKRFGPTLTTNGFQLCIRRNAVRFCLFVSSPIGLSSWS